MAEFLRLLSDSRRGIGGNEQRAAGCCAIFAAHLHALGLVLHQTLCPHARMGDALYCTVEEVAPCTFQAAE